MEVIIFIINMEKQLQPTLCKCGFFANPKTGGLCSKCFNADLDKKKKAETEAPKINPSEDITKCYLCQRKLGIYGVPCKCCHVFCSLHRHFDDHKCTYDFKKAYTAKLVEANPIVAPSKMH